MNDHPAELTEAQKEILRRMVPGRWYYDTVHPRYPPFSPTGSGRETETGTTGVQGRAGRQERTREKGGVAMGKSGKQYKAKTLRRQRDRDRKRDGNNRREDRQHQQHRRAA